MEKIVDYLKQLDLSDVEAKLYLAVLQAGPSSVRDLAQTIEIKRTTAYFYIDQLVEKGLIIKLVRGSKKLVAATEPKNIKQLVEEKLRNAEEVKKSFPDILTTLETSVTQDSNIGNAEIRYYKGISGAKKIYEEALKTDEVRSFVNLSAMGSLFHETGDIFMGAFTKNPNLKLFEIFEDSEQSRKAIQAQSKNDRFFYKFHPQEMTFSAADTLIYDGHVSIINVRNEEVTGIVLQNSEYYNNSKELFDFFWKILSNVEK